jgi:hypothetical protein
MAKGLAMKLLPLTFIVSGVVAAQSVPSRKDIPTIAKAANGAIVTIVTADNDKPIARGTGFLVKPDGVILTNYHVIENGNVAIVKFSDGTILPVDGVLAADKDRDLAVIKIHGKTFRTLTLGDSDQIQVGEEVVAIGNPLGLELTVSNGILSGVRVTKEEGKFLQITAPISHGSSGGPLFNMFGEVVGINTMYLEGGENLNFAIPVNDAKNLLRNQSTKLQQLPNEPEADAPKADARRPDAPKEGPSDAASPQERECGRQAEKFIRYESQKADQTIETYTAHYDGQANKCYVEEVLTQHFDTKVTGSTGLRSWSYYIIYDAFFEGANGPEYGQLTFRRNGKIIKDVGCTVWPYGYRSEQAEGPKISCRSKEEFDELTLKYFGTTPPHEKPK